MLNNQDNFTSQYTTDARLAIDDFHFCRIPSSNYVEFIEKISKHNYKETVMIMGLGPRSIMLQMKSVDIKNKYKPLYLIYKK